MKKRINKGLTIKAAKVITSIITVISLILLTVFIIVDISKDGVGAVIVFTVFGLAIVSCIWSICWTVLEAIASNKNNNHVD